MMKDMFALVRTRGAVSLVMKIAATRGALEPDLMPDMDIRPCELYEAPDDTVAGEFVDEFRGGVVIRTQEYTPLSDEERLSRVATRRAAAYPAVGDQLDDIWKTFQRLKADGVTLPDGALERIAEIQAVKTAHPK
jgi:hypothetical protein